MKWSSVPRRGQAIAAVLAAAAVPACGGQGDRPPPLINEIPKTPEGDAAFVPDGAAGADSGSKTDAGGSSDGGGPTGPLVFPAFDPDEIYIFGTLERGTFAKMVVAKLSDPNTYTAGFSSTTQTGNFYVGIHRGALLYIDNKKVEQFVPDYTGPLSSSYPANPELNDKDQNFLCPNGEIGPRQFLVNPSGHIIFMCQTAELIWHDADSPGVPVHQGTEIVLAYGSGDLVATMGPSPQPFGVMHLADDVVHYSTPAIAVSPGLVRSYKDGFRAIAPDGAKAALWEIDSSGHVTKVGDYPAAPPNADVTSSTVSILARDGSLIQDAGNLDAPGGLIFRLGVDGTSKVVYTEASKPAVLLDSSESLFTGP